jgi:archaellum component FlaF (FlaF/FlaG flagellin family)
MVAAFILFVSIFVKKMIIYIALVPAWMGVIATANNQYIDATAGVVLIYAILSAFLKHREVV